MELQKVRCVNSKLNRVRYFPVHATQKPRFSRKGWVVEDIQEKTQEIEEKLKVIPKKETPKEPVKQEPKVPKQVLKDYNDITTPEIKEFLDGKGYPYLRKDTKPKLYEQYKTFFND